MTPFKSLLGIGLLALGAQSAMAEGPIHEDPPPVASATTRDEVKRAALHAIRAGTIARGEASFELPAKVTDSGLTRAQVRAEAIAAGHLGLIARGELPLRDATPFELEHIRQAGLKARQPQLAVRWE